MYFPKTFILSDSLYKTLNVLLFETIIHHRDTALAKQRRTGDSPSRRRMFFLFHHKIWTLRNRVLIIGLIYKTHYNSEMTYCSVNIVCICAQNWFFFFHNLNFYRYQQLRRNRQLLCNHIYRNNGPKMGYQFHFGTYLFTYFLKMYNFVITYFLN